MALKFTVSTCGSLIKRQKILSESILEILIELTHLEWNNVRFLPHIGFLSAIGSLMMTVQDSTISLTWTAPFTLDIPGDPDITYCVSMVNSTSSSTLHSPCGITETGFSFSIPPDSACHNYTFTFTVIDSSECGG